MNLRLVAIAVAVLVPSSNAALAKDELSMQGILSVAKMTGACGILQAQSTYW